MSENRTHFYQWEGVSGKGVVLTGKIEAASEMEARIKLRKRGIQPRKLKRIRSSLFSGKIKRKDVVVVVRQLSTMIESGVPIIKALTIIAEGTTNPKLRDVVLDLRNTVEGGEPLHRAFRKYPDLFDDMFCNLVESGEKSGALENILKRLAAYMENMESIKGRIRKAMIYPAAILTVAFGVTLLMLLFVIPQFKDIFDSYGAQLPAFTQGVIDLSNFIKENVFLIFVSLAVGVVAFLETLKRNENFRYFIHRAILKVPVFGPLILEKIAISRICRTLAIMLSAGVPLVQALGNAAKTAGNLVFQKEVLRILTGVSAGERLGRLMRSSGVFPEMVAQLVEIGEESGTLEEMLNKVADFNDEETDNTINALSSLMEPAIMVILGLTVGSLVLAMYLPIFKLGSVI